MTPNPLRDTLGGCHWAVNEAQGYLLLFADFSGPFSFATICRERTGPGRLPRYTICHGVCGVMDSCTPWPASRAVPCLGIYETAPIQLMHVGM